MRVLNAEELRWVAGAGDECVADNAGTETSGNNFGGVSNTSDVGQDIINLYEGAIEAMSHMIERVASAL